MQENGKVNPYFQRVVLLLKDQNKRSQKAVHSPSSRKLTNEIRTWTIEKSVRKKEIRKVKNKKYNCIWFLAQWQVKS